MSVEERLIIAIDGPAGVGKTTVARELAEVLNIHHIDTGAMYRAFAYYVMKIGLSPERDGDCGEVLKNFQMEYLPEINSYKIIVNGEEVSDKIRTREVTKGSSDVAVFPAVRKFMVNIQRELGNRYDLVMEGRDIGTNVFPDTPFKFYLDARIEARVERRLLQDGLEITDECIKREFSNIITRDKNDMEREFAPLRVADDAIIIDTTNLTRDEVVEKILKVVREK